MLNGIKEARGGLRYFNTSRGFGANAFLHPTTRRNKSIRRGCDLGDLCATARRRVHSQHEISDVGAMESSASINGIYVAILALYENYVGGFD